jgi:hypothetical protein
MLELANSTSKGGASGRTRVDIINSFIVGLLRALVDQWITSYKKPVITTTFTEEQVKLVGNHYDYTSGKRAARVLLHLTTYHDFLVKTGKITGFNYF